MVAIKAAAQFRDALFTVDPSVESFSYAKIPLLNFGIGEALTDLGVENCPPLSEIAAGRKQVGELSGCRGIGSVLGGNPTIPRRLAPLPPSLRPRFLQGSAGVFAVFGL